MTPTTRIALSAGAPRARVELVVGALAPRLIRREERRAHVALTAAGMILLGGDTVHLDVDVGPGCVLELEDIGGTVAYPSRGTPSSWMLDIRLAEGATLLWRSLPFVVAAEADVERRTRIRLADRAACVLRETVVLGRHGETGGHVASEIEAWDGDGPVLLERLEADGTRPEPGILGRHRVIDAVIALGFRPVTRPGDLVLDRPGAMARHLGAQTHESRLDDVWLDWAQEATAPPSPPIAGIPVSSAAAR